MIWLPEKAGEASEKDLRAERSWGHRAVSGRGRKVLRRGAVPRGAAEGFGEMRKDGGAKEMEAAMRRDRRR